MGLDNVNSSSGKNLDKKIITIKDNNGNEQKVQLSVFVEGMAISADNKSALSLFDTNNDGKISEEEVIKLKKAIVKNAGHDKTLDDKEILKIFNLTIDSKKAAKILNNFKTMVERQFKGELETTVTTPDGRIIKSNFKRDGSGTTEVKTKQKETIHNTYAKGKVLEKTTKISSDGTVTTTEYKNNDKGQHISSDTTVKSKTGKILQSYTTTYTYDRKTGRLTEEKTEEVTGKPMKLPNGETVTPKKVTTKQYEYDENGKINKKTTTTSDGKNVVAEFKDGHIVKQTTSIRKMSIYKENGKSKIEYKNSSEVMDYTYHANGNKQSVTIHREDSYGKASDMVYNYNTVGKMISATKTYFKRGAKVEEKYDGENLENRTSGGVPSEKIIYEDENGTKIKERIVNMFDEDGVLIGDIVYDGNNNKIGEHDYSKLDGKFDTAYQMSRGDCYLLAAVNALSSTEAGAKLLKDTIKTDGENYTVTFPGAESARNDLIKTLREKNPNVDISKITIRATYTVTAEELKSAMKKAGSKYSVGDKDVLLLEVAYEKYRKSVAETLRQYKLKTKDYMAGFKFNSQFTSKGDYLSGGTAAEALFIITGKESEAIYESKDRKNSPICYVDADFQMHVADNNGNIENEGVTLKQQTQVGSFNSNTEVRDDVIEKLIKDSADGKLDKYAATASFTVSSQEVNGKVIQGGGHAFTIKKVTREQVILMNPWNPEKDVIMSMNDFKKACYRIQLLNFDDNTVTTPVTHEPADSNSNHVQQPQLQAETQTQPTDNNIIKTIKPRSGQGYTAFIINLLKEQGIDIKNSKDPRITKAKQQFEKVNKDKNGKDLVGTYNGKKSEWKGNRFLYADVEYKIPRFDV